jgi:outer membrane protein, heavy metal efflux system
MRTKLFGVLIAVLIAMLAATAEAWPQDQQTNTPNPQGQSKQDPSSQTPRTQMPGVPTSASPNGPIRITLDEAVQLALQHNHSLLAARSTILQNQASEVTANLRPDPVLLADTQFLPLFQPQDASESYFDQDAQFDIGLSYLFERGKKRQHRLQAAKDQTAVTTSTVSDNERTISFTVASDFVTVQLAESTLALADQDLKSFQNTVDVSELRVKDGDMSEADFLKIKLQLLQFQTDYSQATLSRIQALAALRNELGLESVPGDFDVAGELDYAPVHANREDLESIALRERPDLRAAIQGVTAAESQYELQKAIGKRDITGTLDYSHVSGVNSASVFFQMPLPIFDRNQGEILRTKYAITQAQENQRLANDQVLTDVLNAYEGLKTNDEIVRLYRSGYLDQAQQSRDISEYSYKHGAASLLDFLDSERSYRAVQLAYRQALAAYQTAVEQLREAVGTRKLP